MSNKEAYENLIEQLKAKHPEALIAPEPLIQLGLTLATDMDCGDTVSCTKCGFGVVVNHNAALVKQYREVLEVLTADVSDDDTKELWEDFHNAGSSEI